MNTTSCDVAISASVKGGEWTHALHVVSSVAGGGIQADTITCIATMSAWEKSKH